MFRLRRGLTPPQQSLRARTIVPPAPRSLHGAAGRPSSAAQRRAAGRSVVRRLLLLMLLVLVVLVLVLLLLLLLRPRLLPVLRLPPR